MLSLAGISLLLLLLLLFQVLQILQIQQTLVLNGQTSCRLRCDDGSCGWQLLTKTGQFVEKLLITTTDNFAGDSIEFFGQCSHIGARHKKDLRYLVEGKSRRSAVLLYFGPKRYIGGVVRRRGGKVDGRTAFHQLIEMP